MLHLVLLTLLCGQSSGISSIRPEGTRTKITVGELFIPAGFQSDDARVHVLVHLHGSPELLERHLVKSGWNAVTVNISLNGLSGVYAKQFADPQVFQRLLSETEAALAKHFDQKNIRVQRVTVSSFSAGFGGVRELLKSDDHYQRIDTLIMADSIYAGYTGELSERQVDPRLMAGFLRFARDAAAGRKELIISHCQLQPDGYASTAETADYLMRELGLTRKPVNETWAEQWQCTSHCEQGKLHVFGFSGTEGTDHMRHLRNLDKLMRVCSL